MKFKLEDIQCKEPVLRGSLHFQRARAMKEQDLHLHPFETARHDQTSSFSHEVASQSGLAVENSLASLNSSSFQVYGSTVQEHHIYSDPRGSV